MFLSLVSQLSHTNPLLPWTVALFQHLRENLEASTLHRGKLASMPREKAQERLQWRESSDMRCLVQFLELAVLSQAWGSILPVEQKHSLVKFSQISDTKRLV